MVRCLVAWSSWIEVLDTPLFFSLAACAKYSHGCLPPLFWLAVSRRVDLSSGTKAKCADVFLSYLLRHFVFLHHL